MFITPDGLGFEIPESIMHDLHCAVDDLASKTPEIDAAWAYYNGAAPKKWLTEKMRSMFGRLADDMDTNLCEGAIDHVVRRLNVTGFILDDQVGGEDGNADPDANPDGTEADDVTKAEQFWQDNGLDLEQDEIFRAADVAGEAFVIVWPDEDGTPGEFDIYENDARNIHLHMDDENPREKDHAVKMWIGHDGVWRATMYYPDVVIRLVGPKATDTPTTPGQYVTKTYGQYNKPDVKAFVFADEPGGASPFPGQIPVFRFAVRRKRRSRLHNLAPIQDRINKLTSNKIVAAEFGAFKQRYFLSTQEIDDESVRQSPDKAIILDPGGDLETGVAATSVGEFSATELANYDNSIAQETGQFYAVANLPKHLMVNSGMDPSGDAVRADEGPFVAMCQDRVRAYTATIEDIFDLLGLNVSPQWDALEISNDSAVATTVKMFADAGAPLEVIVAKYAGWTEDEIESITKAKTDAAKQAKDQQAALMTAMDQGVGSGQPGSFQTKPDPSMQPAPQTPPAPLPGPTTP